MQAESLTAVAGHPALNVAVVMRREPLTGPMARWQTWRWVLAATTARVPLRRRASTCQRAA